MTELDRDGYYEDEIHLICVVNFTDNPWWNTELEMLRQWDYDNRPRAEYDWIWLGKFNDTVDNSIIKPEWFDACLDLHKQDRFPVTISLSVFSFTYSMIEPWRITKPAASPPSSNGSSAT